MNFDRNIKEIYFKRNLWKDYPKLMNRSNETMDETPSGIETAAKCLNSQFLENVEKISADGWYNEILRNVLKHCPKIKYLRFHYQGRIHLQIAEQQDVWPTVKYFAYHSHSPCELDKILDRLPNVQSLSIYYGYSVKWLLQSERKFDDLTIYIHRSYEWQKRTQISDDLRMLHEKQVAKRIHLFQSLDGLMYKTEVPRLGLKSLVLHVRTLPKSQHLFIDPIVRETNLKLLVYKSSLRLEPRYIEMLAKKLINLEEFHISLSMDWIGMIMPFVRYSSKLKIIHIRHDSDDSSGFLSPTFNTTLQYLNEERQKLEAASKLTIFLREDHYLYMKSNSLCSSYGLVNIKRTSVYASNNPFFIFEDQFY